MWRNIYFIVLVVVGEVVTCVLNQVDNEGHHLLDILGLTGGHYKIPASRVYFSASCLVGACEHTYDIDKRLASTVTVSIYCMRCGAARL
jgi:hypothetical protein